MKREVKRMSKLISIILMGFMGVQGGCISMVPKRENIVIVESDVDQDMSIISGVLLNASVDATIWSKGEITYRLRGASFFRLREGAEICIQDKGKQLLKVQTKK